MVQPIFWKTDSTFVSEFLSSTCRGIPATSKHSLLDYWAFAQHWHSTVTILLQSSLFTRLVTSSAWSLAKLSLNLCMVLLSSVILFCNDRTIGMSSLFSILSKASSVSCDMVDIVARWRSCWKVRTLHQDSDVLWSLIYFLIWSFFLLRLLCISINLPYTHVCNTVVTSCYLELLDKLQKRKCRIVDPSLAASLEPLARCRNVARWSLFYRYYFGRWSSELAQLVPLPFPQGRSTHYSDR